MMMVIQLLLPVMMNGLIQIKYMYNVRGDKQLTLATSRINSMSSPQHSLHGARSYNAQTTMKTLQGDIPKQFTIVYSYIATK